MKNLKGEVVVVSAFILLVGFVCWITNSPVPFYITLAVIGFFKLIDSI